MTNPPAFAASYRLGPLRVAVVMTGGTIAKTYDAGTARLANQRPAVKEVIAALRTDDLEFSFHDVLHKDSLDIGEDDRTRIVGHIVSAVHEGADAVVVTHGTDSVVETGRVLARALPEPSIPVIFTGAMVPHVVAGSDAVQNVAEALLAARLVPPGLFLVFHNRILPIESARKDHGRMTFNLVAS